VVASKVVGLTHGSPGPYVFQVSDENSGDGPCGGVGGDCLTSGEMARLSNTTLRTVRFYEEEGLITAQAREDGCQRRFPRSELTKLQTIADLRDAGLSLQEVKDLVDLKQKSGCTSAPEAAARMSAAIAERLADIEKRACALERVRRELIAMTAALESCNKCTKPAFPTNCRGCTDTSVKDAERPAVLLWKH
jgi:DNA-binding transcriptional MerR regulator